MILMLLVQTLSSLCLLKLPGSLLLAAAASYVAARSLSPRRGSDIACATRSSSCGRQLVY